MIELPLFPHLHMQFLIRTFSLSPFVIFSTDFPYPVECWLALAENNVDSEAYRYRIEQ